MPLTKAPEEQPDLSGQGAVVADLQQGPQPGRRAFAKGQHHQPLFISERDDRPPTRQDLHGARPPIGRQIAMHHDHPILMQRAQPFLGPGQFAIGQIASVDEHQIETARRNPCQRLARRCLAAPLQDVVVKLAGMIAQGCGDRARLAILAIGPEADAQTAPGDIQLVHRLTQRECRHPVSATADGNIARPNRPHQPEQERHMLHQRRIGDKARPPEQRFGRRGRKECVGPLGQLISGFDGFNHP